MTPTPDRGDDATSDTVERRIAFWRRYQSQTPRSWNGEPLDLARLEAENHLIDEFLVDLRAVGEAVSRLEGELVEQRVIGHGEGQEHAIADVNAGLVDDKIAPRLEAAEALLRERTVEVVTLRESVSALQAHHRLCECPVDGYDGTDCTFRASATEYRRAKDTAEATILRLREELLFWLGWVDATSLPEGHTGRFYKTLETLSRAAEEGSR